MIESDKPNTQKRYRSKNGQPRTYFDNNTGRYIAPAVVYLPSGKRKLVRGSGIRKSIAETKRDKLVRKYESLIEVDSKNLSLTADYCQHWLDNVKPSTFYAWLSRKELSANKLGHNRYITNHQLKEFSTARSKSEYIDRTYQNGNTGKC